MVRQFFLKGAPLLVIGLVAATAARPAAQTLTDGQRWWSHVQFLADDKLEGRNTGSEGHRKAAEYVAQQFKRNGLLPSGEAGFFQPVPLRSLQVAEGQSSVALVKRRSRLALNFGDDIIVAPKESGKPIKAKAVFAGYAMAAPEKQVNDLAGLDLKGKIAVFISGGPSSIQGNLSAHYQSAVERWKSLRRSGAIGTISIPNPRTMEVAWSRQAAARSQVSMLLQDPALDETPGQRFSAVINPARADLLFAGTAHRFSDLLALADAGKPLPRFPLKLTVRASVAVREAPVESQNVIGILPGSDPRFKDEYVVVSAHLDHLGLGVPVDGDSIYNGAMDNASGVAALLEISRYLHEAPKVPRRSVIFLVTTGEERGLAGSRYFVMHPPVKLEGIVADLNMDMFLPVFPFRVLMSFGLDESDLADPVRAVAQQSGIEVQGDPEPERNRFIRSDQYSFIRRGIPAMAFKFGYERGSAEDTVQKEWTKRRYHAPSDDLNQPVNLDAAAQFARLISSVAERIANQSERPRWKNDSFFRRFAAAF